MIDAFFKERAALDEVEAIALGGSRAGEDFDEKSDYDIYLYCTAPVPATRREEIYAQYCSYVELGNCFWELEDNGTFLNGNRLPAARMVPVENGVKFQMHSEEFMLFFGTEAERCAERRQLVYLRNPATGSVRILPGETFPLDRMHQWEDGSLNDDKISRQHAKICFDAAGCYLEDLGSRNGTYCNERKLAANAKCRLLNGDQIRLGDTVLQMNIVTF